MVFTFYKRGFALFILILFIILIALTNEAFYIGMDVDSRPSKTKITQEKPKATEPKRGGTIVGAMYSAPTGMFNPIFYEEAYEANILSFTHESLFSQDANLEYEGHLAKDWNLNKDHTELIVYLQEDVTWHDGEPFTAEDVVFTYQSIADPDYVSAGGVRISYVEPLLGFQDYQSGQTDEFKGVQAINDHTVVFRFTEPNVTPLYTAGFTIIPKHVFEGIPIKDMPEAAESYKAGAVIGTGPFKFTDMIDREQYVLERNENYWKSAPYLDKIIWKVVAQSVMTGLLETGEIDFIADPGGIAPADYDMINELRHIHIIEQIDFGYQLLGFKHHHRTAQDVEDGLLKPDNWIKNDRLPIDVRQAIAYAIHREAFIHGLLYEHGQTINSPIAPQFWAYDEESTVNYHYDPEKAKQILTNSGYIDIDNDGFREDPKGNKWVLNLDYPTGNELRERSAPHIKQQLEDVGIKINLRQPKEMSAYVEGLANDLPDWDLYLLGWSLATGDPNPSGLWATTAPYNYSRWYNPKSNKLLQQAVKAPLALDQSYRAQIYAEWQRLFSEDLPAILLYAGNSLWAYNDRIQGIILHPSSMYQDPHLWWVNDVAKAKAP